MITFGIDPGYTGAIAALRGHQLYALRDMPVVKGHLKVKDEIDEKALYDWISGIVLLHDNNSHAFIEKVSAMPGQGVTSTFRFGVSYGIVRAIVAALSIPVTLITPQAWQGAVNLGTAPKDKRKALARQRAAQLFPSFSEQFYKVKDSGKADAVLIAYAGHKQLA